MSERVSMCFGGGERSINGGTVWLDELSCG